MLFSRPKRWVLQAVSCILVVTSLLGTVSLRAAVADEAGFAKARHSAEIAGYSLSKMQRWLHEVALQRIDKQTGLYIADGHWNYRDTAADCYPFLTWVAFYVDQDALNGPVRRVLHAEQEICNLVDRIPVPYDYKNKKQIDPGYDQMVFQASEYVKDGLIAIVEVTGKDEWFDRMLGIEEDLWKHARYDTPYGKIPSKNLEVNGEQIQALVRLYSMTGDDKFMRWAERLADYYLLQDDFVPKRLRDHGCEIIGGLGILLGVESERNPQKAAVHLPRMKRMLDEIQKRGTNEDGMMFNRLGDPRSGLSDGWGYNYVTNLCYDMVAGKPVYRNRIEHALRSLAKPKYANYSWEGQNIDGYADSIEGALYLVNRLPVPEAVAWIDREMAANVVHSKEPLETASLWGTMKLESNGVRTTLIHALMHTQGTIARPWRQDLALGATRTDRGLAVVISAKKDWHGKLVFDIPRHRLYMGFQRDWPRMNTMPEWFTAELDRTYAIENVADGTQKKLTGRQMHDGIPLNLQAGKELRLVVQ